MRKSGVRVTVLTSLAMADLTWLSTQEASRRLGITPAPCTGSWTRATCPPTAWAE